MKILILGGTTEAVSLAKECETIEGMEFITSLAGRTTKSAPLNTTTRIGGFGGVTGLAAYLKDNKIDALIDATHPFAAQISFNAHKAAQDCKVPHILLTRPQWKPAQGDRWIEVDTISSAAIKIPDVAQRIFLTIGRQELNSFSHLKQNWFLMRMIDPPQSDVEIPPGELLLEKGPFSLEHEIDILEKYKIQAIVSKNSGGYATEAKIVAARMLQLPVIMVKRPNSPKCYKVEDIESVLLWLKQIKNNRS